MAASQSIAEASGVTTSPQESRTSAGPESRVQLMRRTCALFTGL